MWMWKEKKEKRYGAEATLTYSATEPVWSIRYGGHVPPTTQYLLRAEALRLQRLPLVPAQREISDANSLWYARTVFLPHVLHLLI